jgi:hypothetical protein
MRTRPTGHHVWKAMARRCTQSACPDGRNPPGDESVIKPDQHLVAELEELLGAAGSRLRSRLAAYRAGGSGSGPMLGRFFAEHAKIAR